MRKIVTTHVHPPIPVRTSDWCAHYEGEEEAGNYGWGATEEEAFADFIENCAEDHDERLGSTDMKHSPSYETAVTDAIARLQANSDAAMVRRKRINTDARVLFLSGIIAANATRISEGGAAGLSQMTDAWGTPAYFRRLRAKQLYLVRRAILADGVSHRAGEVLSYCAELRRQEKAALAAGRRAAA